MRLTPNPTRTISSKKTQVVGLVEPEDLSMALVEFLENNSIDQVKNEPPYCCVLRMNSLSAFWYRAYVCLCFSGLRLGTLILGSSLSCYLLDSSPSLCQACQEFANCGGEGWHIVLTLITRSSLSTKGPFSPTNNAYDRLVGTRPKRLRLSRIARAASHHVPR